MFRDSVRSVALATTCPFPARPARSAPETDYVRCRSRCRWYEGRKTWQGIQSTTRNLIRTLVFTLPPPSNSPHDAQRTAAIKELCSLVCAFPFSVMYRLRDQPGIEHAELRNLLPVTLVESYRSTPLQARERPAAATEKRGSFVVEHSSAPEEDRAIAGLNAPPSAERFFPHALPTGEPSNLPLSLIRAMQAYLAVWHEKTSVLDGVTFAACNNALKEFTDSLTALERIRDSESTH
jgi:putative membrane protein